MKDEIKEEINDEMMEEMDSIDIFFIKYREIISYLFWGGATTCVSWGTYTVFAAVLNTSVIVANILSWVFAVIFAYITNKIWVFQSKSWKRDVIIQELGLFLSTRFATGLFEIIAVPFLVNVGMDQTIFGVKGAVSKVVVSVLVVILNYIFSKLVIFKKNKQQPVN